MYIQSIITQSVAPGVIINDRPNFENTADRSSLILTDQTGETLVSCKV